MPYDIDADQSKRHDRIYAWYARKAGHVVNNTNASEVE
ncbi:hypothetical protein AWB73_06737 [Caballeronia turbans]|nr:hypothetical protein AWB73_06737 [Caballeronia turbans]